MAELLKPVFQNHLEYFLWQGRRFLSRAKAGLRSICVSMLFVLTLCLAAEASFRARSLLQFLLDERMQAAQETETYCF